MNPRKPLSFRQEIAQTRAPSDVGFAKVPDLGNAVFKGAPVPGDPSLVRLRTPSLPLRSGPSGVGPAFRKTPARETAALRRALWITKNFLFPSTGNAITLISIKTPTRGRTSCTRPSPSSPFSPCRWPAAWKIPQRAVWPALPVGPSLPMHSTATPLPALSSAALPGPLPAASTSVCRPATDLAVAPDRSTTPRPSGHPARMAFLHVRKAQF